MPALATETGPFKGHRSGWIGEEPEIGTGERGAVVAFYLAMVTSACLSNIGHDGAIIVEGPFASNRIFLDMLAVASGSRVFRASGTTGTSMGAALLASGKTPSLSPIDAQAPAGAEATAALLKYAMRWKQEAVNRSER